MLTFDLLKLKAATYRNPDEPVKLFNLLYLDAPCLFDTAKYSYFYVGLYMSFCKLKKRNSRGYFFSTLKKSVPLSNTILDYEFLENSTKHKK